MAVLGHAFGNRIARTLASDQPALVRELLLLACGGIGADRAGGARVAERVLRAWPARGGAPGARRARLLCRALARGAVARRLVSRRRRVPGCRDDATPVENWWLGEKDVLILQPACDAIAPVENARRLAEPLGERARVVEIADAGHAALPEQPEAIARAVIAFLRRSR